MKTLRKLLILNIGLNLLLAQETGAQTTPGQIKQVSQLPADSMQARKSPSKAAPAAANTTQPRLPALPKIGRLSELVTKFGAVPNDGKDDTVAIQNAIDAVAKKGGSVLFPPGVYNISIQRQLKQPQALKLRSGIKLAASTTKGATLKLADRQGNYESIMGTEEYGTPLTDFAIQGLTIDSNGQNNPVLSPEGPGGKVSADFGTENNLLPRTAVRVYVGKRISIDRTRFTNQNAVWSVVINGKLDGMTDAAITNSRFDNVGGNAVDFDHSSIYTQGSRMLVENNTFISRFGPGTKGARTAIEIHGNDQIVRGNTIKGFTNGINVTGAGTPVSQRQLYENNLIDGANTGFTLWFNIHKGNSASQPAMQQIVIRRNTVNISSDKWVEPGIVSDSGPSAGIMLDPNSNAPLQDVTIADNRINFVNAKPVHFAHDRFSSGITLWKYTNQNTPIERLTISGNRITNAPGAGIWSNAALGGAGSSKIENNTIVNPARSIHLAGDKSGQARAGIYLQSNSNNKNLRIQGNTISDTLQPTRLKYGIVANSACAGSCSIKQNTVKAPASTPVQANVSWGGRAPVSNQSSVIFTNLGKVLVLCLLFPIVLVLKPSWRS
ncbi:right-handed parallel beta-helix repeat-containing protein [Chamaesiphon minutus]|uniref:Endopolygalacturonase n=1 Tax=Chamaesiphon minutus (strain ATCC 27169 / PCC 6605) TaxID=1173020 RepID=K9UKM9_CHAP6|nr:right-handed parallel beta-helix repeat-containing protein [Chamaesiphon minutus]AFY95365.1 endopolygalacturonase [Chamaesiphon minutus PCC 6605]